VRIAPLGTDAYAPAFDVTPAALISAIITERGVIRTPNTGSVRELLGNADGAKSGGPEETER
jgi:methylthioribose-1-phosphate isomerase